MANELLDRFRAAEEGAITEEEEKYLREALKLRPYGRLRVDVIQAFVAGRSFEESLK